MFPIFVCFILKHLLTLTVDGGQIRILQSGCEPACNLAGTFLWRSGSASDYGPWDGRFNFSLSQASIIFVQSAPTLSAFLVSCTQWINDITPLHKLLKLQQNCRCISSFQKVSAIFFCVRIVSSQITQNGTFLVKKYDQCQVCTFS